MTTKGVPLVLVANSVLTAIAKGVDAAYYIPTVTGAAVPATATLWRLDVNQINVPASATYELAVEFQRLASWTDKAGIVHPAGEWLFDAGFVFSGGQITRKDGTTTFINSLGSTIGAVDPNGNMVEPFPDNIRVKVIDMGTWILPAVRITIS